MRQETKITKFDKRLQRAEYLETAFVDAFISTGLWAHRIRNGSASAPLLRVPLSDLKTRAPDIIVFKADRYCLIEIKESLVDGQHFTLYDHQLRDYFTHLMEVNCLLVVCVSEGDYGGYVGCISLHRLKELVILEHQRDRILIPVMALDLLGTYKDTQIRLMPKALYKALNCFYAST